MGDDELVRINLARGIGEKIVKVNLTKGDIKRKSPVEILDVILSNEGIRREDKREVSLIKSLVITADARTEIVDSEGNRKVIPLATPIGESYIERINTEDGSQIQTLGLAYGTAFTKGYQNK